MVRTPKASGKKAAKPTKPKKKHILIVCEGKTEAGYLKAFRQHFRLPNMDIESCGLDPSKLLTRAEDKAEKADPPYDEIYCVFDKDTHAHYAATQQAISKKPAQPTQWHAITSNPCFEVWLLCHYEILAAPIESDGGRTAAQIAKDKMGQHIAGYHETHPDIETLARDDTKRANAHTNAEKMHQISGGTQGNPATEIPTLLAALTKSCS